MALSSNGCPVNAQSEHIGSEEQVSETLLNNFQDTQGTRQTSPFRGKIKVLFTLIHSLIIFCLFYTLTFFTPLLSFSRWQASQRELRPHLIENSLTGRDSLQNPKLQPTVSFAILRITCYA